MASVSVDGVLQAEYEYNFLGQQVIRKLVSTGKTIHNIFDLDGNRIAEYDYDATTGTSSLIREYIWANGVVVAVVENDQIYYVHTDNIGRPVFATNGAGAKVWEVSYKPFGGVDVTLGGAIDLRFPGQWFQAESGLHQNWMRDYDPTTGRYMQADPLGLVDGSSVFGYAMQSPNRYADPRGEKVYIVCRPLSGFGGSISGQNHCFIVVVSYNCPCNSGFTQFSLAGGDTGFNAKGASSKSVYSTDRAAWNDRNNPLSGTREYPIETPWYMSECDFDSKVIGVASRYSQGPYSAFHGPNSNTAAKRAVDIAGGTTPYLRDAWGQ